MLSATTLLLLAACAKATADVACICTTDSCVAKGLTTCTARRTCFVQYEKALFAGSRTRSSADDDYYENEDDEYEDFDEAYIVRGCVERADLVRCDNAGPSSSARLRFPYVYCCQREFCNNAHVGRELAEDAAELTDWQRPAARGANRPSARSTRRVTTVRRRLALLPTARERATTARLRLLTVTTTGTNATRTDNGESFRIHPVYIVLLVSSGTVLLMVLAFAVIVLKRHHRDEDRLEAARKFVFLN